MTIHITTLNGMALNNDAQNHQQIVANYGRQLGMNKFCIFTYNWPDEPVEALNTRFDGIMASLNNGDTVILQSPSWISMNWDQAFIDHLFIYQAIQKIIFIHDVIPLIDNNKRDLLPNVINYYNTADVLIVPSQNMYDFLRKNGLQKKKYVIQHFFDHPYTSTIESSTKPKNSKTINFVDKFPNSDYINQWSSSDIKLKLYGARIDPSINNNPNVELAGQKSDPALLAELRQTGGFGFAWSQDEYSHLHPSYIVSTYLAAGIPVIVSDTSPIAEKIKKKKLGIVATSLEEIPEKISTLSDEQYEDMIKNVDKFSKLIRNGYFTKKVLIDSVMKDNFE